MACVRDMYLLLSYTVCYTVLYVHIHLSTSIISTSSHTATVRQATCQAAHLDLCHSRFVPHEAIDIRSYCLCILKGPPSICFCHLQPRRHMAQTTGNLDVTRSAPMPALSSAQLHSKWLQVPMDISHRCHSSGSHSIAKEMKAHMHVADPQLSFHGLSLIGLQPAMLSPRAHAVRWQPNFKCLVHTCMSPQPNDQPPRYQTEITMWTCQQGSRHIIYTLYQEWVEAMHACRTRASG